MRCKQVFRVVAGGVAAMLAVVLLALPVLALSENAQAVVTRLETMQQANIDPAWTPDIEANQTAVQELLDLYKKCSPAERAEFTPEQNSGLRAYFDALYNVQGKDKAELDDLFAGRSVASSAPASSASAAASSSSLASSAASSSASSSSASASSQAAASSSSQSGSSGAVASSGSAPSSQAGSDAGQASSAAGGDSSSGVPGAAYGPQVPSGGGPFGFLGSKAISALLLVVICVLAAAVFVRFLVSLRAAGKVKTEEPDAAMQELHGSVDPYTLPALAEDAGAFPAVGEAPPLQREEKRMAKRAAREEKEARMAEQNSEKVQNSDDFEDNDVNRAFSNDSVWGGKAYSAQELHALQAEQGARQGSAAPQAEPLRGKRREADRQTAELIDMPGLFAAAGGARQEAAKPAAGPKAAQEGDAEPKAPAQPRGRARQKAEKEEPAQAAQSAQAAPGTLLGQSFVTLPTGAPRGATKYGARGDRADGDARPNARTGKPGKMTFNQGRPEDIDAIDD